MQSRYIQLTREQALLLRQNLTFLREKLINVQEKIKFYNLLRKKETILRNKLKVCSAGLKSRLKLMESTMPEDEIKHSHHAHKFRVISEPKKHHEYQKSRMHVHNSISNPKTNTNNSNIERDLADIKDKLRRLS